MQSKYSRTFPNMYMTQYNKFQETYIFDFNIWILFHIQEISYGSNVYDTMTYLSVITLPVSKASV